MTPPAPRSLRPNVLLIVVDAGRLDRFGCYGYPRRATPAIDDLARQGTLYERMIAPAPWTLPGHASLFTGLYSREHGADRPALKMRSGLLTVAEHLQHAGYETIFVSNNPLVSRRTGIIDGDSQVLLRRNFDRTFRRGWTRRLDTFLGRSDSGSGATNRVVAELLRKTTKPFFIFINYMECHWKYAPPRSFERRFVRQPFSAIASALYRLRVRRRYSWENATVASAEELALMSDLYDASLACVDDRVGHLLRDLDRSGKGDETIVIVTADHGENIGDHGLTGHGMSLYQTLLHVPFVVRTPGKPAARVRGLVQLTDVFAGLCGLLGVEVPDALRNRRFSIDPFGLREGQPGREFAFAEWHQWEGERLQKRLQRAPNFRTAPSMESVQDERYKLIAELASGTEWLFDLQADPTEQVNRAGELPERRARLVHALEEWRAVSQPSGVETAYTQEEQKALEARLAELGYM